MPGAPRSRGSLLIAAASRGARDAAAKQQIVVVADAATAAFRQDNLEELPAADVGKSVRATGGRTI